MERNLDARVEVMVRLDEAPHGARVGRWLELGLADPTAWTLGPDGGWATPNDLHARGMQATLLAEAAGRDHFVATADRAGVPSGTVAR